jgi:hypothetical protein
LNLSCSGKWTVESKKKINFVIDNRLNTHLQLDGTGKLMLSRIKNKKKKREREGSGIL